MRPAPLVHLVDDDPAIRDALTLMFRSRGFRPRAYRAAEECLAEAGPKTSGCIVADMRLPDMTGVELTRRLRASGATPPVVIITACAGASLAVEAMAAGASDLLEKPFDDEALLASVRRALAARRGEGDIDAETRAALARFGELSEDERRVLAGVAKGRPSRDIAEGLGLELRAVELHRANIMAKANIGTLVELARLSVIAASVKASEGREPNPPMRRRRSNLRGAAAA
ncbi:response regulator transcription factor [Methylosinus sporium]|uniref:DNA-binding response regulator n=1 Tax=Methylosinus sporium TaxID=428 RepID=A0A2U1SQC6_METSR|nr:response regulator [Methylosinus sporium]PWB93818.1 DNA-binding response regulator [Methylosinus sporium]